MWGAAITRTELNSDSPYQLSQHTLRLQQSGCGFTIHEPQKSGAAIAAPQGVAQTVGLYSPKLSTVRSYGWHSFPYPIDAAPAVPQKGG